MIAEELQHLAVPIDSLLPHPENPRQGDVRQIGESLDRFGQVRPILALAATEDNRLPDGTIIAGHHVWYAAQAKGWDEVAVVRVKMSDAQARAYLVADNRLGDLGQYDDRALLRVLTDLQDEGLEQLTGTGYDSEQIDALRRLLDEEQPAPDPEEPGAGRKECPACGHVWYPG